MHSPQCDVQFVVLCVDNMLKMDNSRWSLFRRDASLSYIPCSNNRNTNNSLRKRAVGQEQSNRWIWSEILQRLHGLHSISLLRQWFSKFQTLCVSYCCLITAGCTFGWLVDQMMEKTSNHCAETYGQDTYFGRFIFVLLCAFPVLRKWAETGKDELIERIAFLIVSLLLLRSNPSDNIIVQFSLFFIFFSFSRPLRSLLRFRLLSSEKKEEEEKNERRSLDEFKWVSVYLSAQIVSACFAKERKREKRTASATIRNGKCKNTILFVSSWNVATWEEAFICVLFHFNESRLELLFSFVHPD